MISEGYRTHRYVTGPMSFKKSGRFSRKIVLLCIWAPGCHPRTLIDPVHPAVASMGSAKTKGMISEGYRTHRGVTGPMNFKSMTFFFFGKTCSRGFWGPGCHPNTLIDLANTALASRVSVETICMICEGYRTHRGVTGPMNFKKNRIFFFGISCSRGFGALGCHPSTLINPAITALANRSSVDHMHVFRGLQNP